MSADQIARLTGQIIGPAIGFAVLLGMYVLIGRAMNRVANSGNVRAPRAPDLDPLPALRNIKQDRARSPAGRQSVDFREGFRRIARVTAWLYWICVMLIGLGLAIEQPQDWWNSAGAYLFGASVVYLVGVALFRALRWIARGFLGDGPTAEERATAAENQRILDGILNYRGTPGA